MTPDEVNSRLTALYRGFRGSYTAAEKSQIEILYYEVTGRTMRSCRCQDRYCDAVIEMLHKLKKNVKMNPKSNYKLVPGVVIQPAGTSEVYTNANLTDEVAVAFLKERPNATAMFEVIPASGNGKVSPAADDVSDAPSPELQAAKDRIAELEAERDAVRADYEALKANIKLDDPASIDQQGADDGAPTEGDSDPTQGDATTEMPAKIKSLIVEKLAEGKSKAAIKTSLAGKTIEAEGGK